VILDLHTHTRWSFDGSMDPVQLVRVARARGLDGIAVTDHDEIEGALEARRAAGGDLLVIVGEEVGTDAGDILGLFLRERVRTRDPLEAVRAIHEQGGLAVLAHPFTKNVSVDERVARAVDACEGFNARHSRGEPADERVVAFARAYGLALTAGSDAHVARDVGRGRTVVPAASLEEARELIRRGHTVLWGRRAGPFDRLARAARRFFRKLGKA
jgi:predicted metal-dependent phosphoesterase TrpH